MALGTMSACWQSQRLLVDLDFAREDATESTPPVFPSVYAKTANTLLCTVSSIAE